MDLEIGNCGYIEVLFDLCYRRGFVIINYIIFFKFDIFLVWYLFFCCKKVFYMFVFEIFIKWILNCVY